jgi:hypothetical protein
MIAESTSRPGGGGGRPAASQKSRRRRWVIAAIGLGVIVWVGFVALSLVRALQDSRSAMATADSARAQLSNGGGILSARSTATLQKANQRFAATHSDLSNPALTPLTVLPWVGTQVRSARAIAASADKLTAVGQQAVSQANAALAQEHGPGPGRVAVLQKLASIADMARTSLVGIDTGPSSGMVGTLAHRHTQLVTDLAKAQDGLTRSAAAARAGADLLTGPRRYLVLAANNAEMRSGQGIVLQVGYLTTGGGRMQLGPMQSVGDVRIPFPGVPVGGDLVARWGKTMPGQHWESLGVTPQFDVTGPVAANLWQAATGQHVDGVIAMDTEALHQVLIATGPVNAGGTVVSADNVIGLLMHDQYLQTTEPGGQTARREQLGAIAKSAFDAVNASNSDLQRLATGLARAGNGRHILVWSAQPNIEDLWRQAGAAGQIANNDLLVGFVNITPSGNKLDWFLKVGDTMEVRPAQGSTDLTVHVQLHNSVPPGQPQYIAGRGLNGSTPGEYAALLAVNLPASASGATIDGNPNPEIVGPEGPTKLLAAQITVMPGQDRDVVVHFRMPGDHGQIRVLPSARVPDVSWDGFQSFRETGAHTVSW